MKENILFNLTLLAYDIYFQCLVNKNSVKGLVTYYYGGRITWFRQVIFWQDTLYKLYNFVIVWIRLVVLRNYVYSHSTVFHVSSKQTNEIDFCYFYLDDYTRFHRNNIRPRLYSGMSNRNPMSCSNTDK